MATMNPQPAEEVLLPRTTSVQRMLDLERKIKIEQMQAHGFTDRMNASRASSRSSSLTMTMGTSPSSPRGPRVKSNSDSNRQNPGNFSNPSRSQHATASPSRQQGPATPTAGLPTAAEEPRSTSSQDDYDQESEPRSSICQSPTWENYARRRKGDRKGAGEEQHEAPHQPARLKRRLPTKPPSASRTHILRDLERQQIGLFPSPILGQASSFRRGRSASTGAEDLGGSLAQGENGGKPAKQKRDRSESLTRRIRATFESRRRESSQGPASRNGSFIGGAKLRGEKAGDGEAPPTPASASNEKQQQKQQQKEEGDELFMAAWDRPSTSGSSNVVDYESASGSPSVAARRLPLRIAATSPLQLRHSGPFSERRSASGQSTESAASQNTKSTDAELPQHHKLHKERPASATESSLAHAQAGYPPSVPYSSTVAAGDNHVCSPLSTTPSPTSRRRSSSVKLGWSLHAGPSVTSVFTSPAAADERQPRSTTRQSAQGGAGGGARRRSVSAIRSIRDAAVSVFQRRSSSRAASQVRDAENPEEEGGRPSIGVSIFSQEQPSSHQPGRHGEQEGDFEDFRNAVSAITHQQDPVSSQSHHHHHHHAYGHSRTSHDRPSDGSSISSYETSMSQPSSVTTPSTSRPQSERGMVSHPTGLLPDHAQKPTVPGAGEQVQQSFDRWAAAHQSDFFEYPDVPTPPLAPKSSKRALATHGSKTAAAREQAAAAGGAPVNFSRESLIPQPLLVSPRNSGHLVRTSLQLDGDDGERPRTAGEGSGGDGSAASRGQLGRVGGGTTGRPEIPERRHGHRSSRPALKINVHEDWRPSSSGTVSSAGGGSRGDEDRQRQRQLQLEPGKPVAKMFVECCRCRFYLDMPSRVYECMLNPEGTVEDKDLGVHGVVTRLVRCPWCGHGMATKCCAGYAAVVFLEEKLH